MTWMVSTIHRWAYANQSGLAHMRPHFMGGAGTPLGTSLMDLLPQLCILLKAASSNHHTLILSLFTTLGATINKLFEFTPSKDLISNLAAFCFAPPITSNPTKWHCRVGPMIFALHTSQNLKAQQKNWEIQCNYGTSLSITHLEAKKLESTSLAPPTSFKALLSLLHHWHKSLSFLFGNHCLLAL